MKLYNKYMVKVQHFRTGDEPNPENINKIQERLERYVESEKLPEIPTSQDQEVIKEKVREALKSMGRETAEATPSFSPSDETKTERELRDVSLLPSYMKSNAGDWEDKKEQRVVSELVAEALHGDILGALKDAGRLPPHLEDAVHDAILEKVIPKLKEAGSFK